MTGVRDILPGIAKPFVLATADAMTDTLPVPIAEIINPATSPLGFLPFLAAHESVDLWFNDWTDERKRAMVQQAVELAALKGTREGLIRFLSFVDAEITWLIAHPARFAMGRSAIAVRPIGHKPMTAHYLVKVPLVAPANPFRIGRAALGRRAFTRVSLEPLRRARMTTVVAKAPETLTSLNFAWRRRARFGDGLPFGSIRFGEFIDRPRL